LVKPEKILSKKPIVIYSFIFRVWSVE